MGAQVPVATPVCAMEHAMQVPEQAVSQQTPPAHRLVPGGPHAALLAQSVPRSSYWQLAPPMQLPVVQSAAVVHFCPTAQGLPIASHVGPPQSSSVSVPFFTPSPHVGGWHIEGAPEQTPFTQSPGTLHFCC
jgi:hypothetical protein